MIRFSTVPAGFSLVAALWLTGCASNDVRPIEQLTRAETSIEQAEDAGAPEHSALELDQARQKLEQAREAAAAEEYGTARLLAEQATADAELAAARAQEAEARQAAAEVRDSIATLRREATRE